MLYSFIAALLFTILGLVMVLIAETKVCAKNYWMVAIISFGMVCISAILFAFFLIAWVLA